MSGPLMELTAREEGPQAAAEIDKAGIICVFYICGLPFVRC